MANLGYCKVCAGPLGVLSRFRQDGERGAFLDHDGKTIPLRADGTPSAPLVRIWEVACTSCGMPVPDHDYQRELNEAAEAERQKQLQPPAAQTLPTYGVADAFALAEQKREALERRIALVERENEHLRAMVQSQQPQKQQQQKQPASK